MHNSVPSGQSSDTTEKLGWSLLVQGRRWGAMRINMVDFGEKLDTYVCLFLNDPKRNSPGSLDEMGECLHRRDTHFPTPRLVRVFLDRARRIRGASPTPNEEDPQRKLFRKSRPLSM